jgi:hypothetical protein
MNKDDLTALLNNPASLKNTDPADYSRIIEEYPYFALPRILQYISRGKMNSENWKDFLKKNATYLNNYKYLAKRIGEYQEYLNSCQDEAIVTSKDIGSKGKDTEPVLSIPENDPGLLTFDFSRNRVGKPELKGADNSVAELVDSETSTIELEERSELETQDPRPIHRKDELIDRFIATNPGSIRPGDSTVPVQPVVNDKIDEDSLITDTLAGIYVKQGLYGKAIYSYEKLILKYPEKSVYFAAQIEDIKKLINK